MANKETRVLKQDTLEILRQKTNEISLHVGDNEQLDALLADKTYSYTASAGQVLFDGADSNSKVTRFELSPQHTIDNTGGSIILEGVSSIDASYTANAIIYQGSAGSETWQAYIVSATTNKIIVRDSSGTFSSSADLKVGTSSPDTIANAKIARIIIESYPVAIARVYNNNTELTQGITANGFFAPKIVGVSSITGSPSIGNAFSEGVTVYQNGSALNTQGDIESSSNWYGVLHSVDSDEIRFKTSQGSFSATAKLRVLGSSDEIAAANHGALTAVDSTYGSYIELTTPAANTNVIKVFSLDLVAAINELQDDIGTVENLTTAANDVVLAINEHDSELGTITAAAMATTASTVSGAIREHEDQIGNVDITGISGSNDTITGALEQIHNEIGDVTQSNLGTSASNLTAAVREHEDQIGNESISSIDSGDSNNTITGALNQLHTEVGSLSLNTSAGDLTAAINEHEADIGNMTLTGLSATDLSAAVRELRAELGNHLEIDDATGYSATTAVGGIKEIQGDIGDVDDLDTNAVSDLVAAINELENVLRDDTTQRTGYVMGTNANNVVAAINEFETVLRGTNSNYTLNTTAQNVRDAINEHESNIGNMIFGSGGPVDVVDPNNISAAIRILDAEIGDTSYTDADITTAIKNIQDDINTTGSLTTLQTTNKFIVGAINEIDADLFNAVGSNRRTMSDLSTADKTSIVDAINEIYADIHTSGSVTLDTEASHLVGAINEIEGVFDASAKNITAGSNNFEIIANGILLNAEGDITLDANGQDIVLNDNATEFGRFRQVGGQLEIYSGNTQKFLVANNTNATFQNNLTVTNDLIVSNDVDIEGNVDVNGSIETDGLSINGTTVTATATELNVMDGNTAATSTTIADADRVVVNDNGTMKQVAVTDLTAYFDHEITNMPNLVESGALNAGSITSGFGSIDVGTSTIDGGIITGSQFRIGNAQIVEAELERIDGLQVGTVAASKVVAVDANKDISGFRHITLTGELDAGSLDVSGNVDIDGTLDIALGSTLRGAVSITNNTASSSSATGALTVAGGVGIGEDLYVAGDLYVEGTRTELNVTTLEVEDTLVLAGNNLNSEPTSGGFGLEVGPITSPSGVAAGVTGAHSIVYNYATDQWEADGSLILSQATLGSPDVKVNDGTSLGDLESSNTLDFLAGSGLSVAGVKDGNDYNITYTNTDKGSSQDIFKNIALPGSVTIAASGNSDTVTFSDDNVVNITGNATDQTIALSHADVFTGTAGDFGQTSTQDGKYIKSLTLTAEGHVSAITTGDFDTRYQATNPYWVLQEDSTEVDQVGNTDIVNFTSGGGIVVGGSKTTSNNVDTSTISIAHADTSSIADLNINNSGGTVLQDVVLTYDTYGHSLTRSFNSVNLDNRYIRSFVVEDGDGSEVTINQANEWKFVEGSGTGATIDINWTDTSTGSDADPYDLTFTVNNTDRGSSQKFFRYVAVSGQTTIDADINEDTLTVEGSSAITVTTDASADKLIIAHSDTSSYNSAPSISTGSATGTVITDFDVNVDTFGHVTGVSGTRYNLDGRYEKLADIPSYDARSISIDCLEGPLPGTNVEVIDTLNFTSNALGHVTAASATKRTIDLADFGWSAWRISDGTNNETVGGTGQTITFNDDGFLTQSYNVSNNQMTVGHPTQSGITANNAYGNSTTIPVITTDSRGHVIGVSETSIPTYDNYNEWRIQADADSTTYGHVDTLEYVKFVGGNKINTTRSGNNITINLDTNHGFLTSQRTATLDVQGNSNNPYIRLNDGTSDLVQIKEHTASDNIAEVTGNEANDTITIYVPNPNTDVDVSVANLKTRLSQASGTITIGDSSSTVVIPGTTTTVNTETVTIQDNIITLNSNSANTPTEDAGLEVERGNSPNVFVRWDEANDRWTFTNNGSTYYNIPISTEYMQRFDVEDGDGTTVTINNQKKLKFVEGTSIDVNFTDVSTGFGNDPFDLTISHKNVTRSDPTANSVLLDYDDQFSAVTGVTTNTQGHITAVNTTQFTLPSIYSLPAATSTVRGGIELFSDSTQSAAANSVTNTPNRTYGVQINSAGQAVVNVPWSNTNTFRTVKVDTNNDGTANATLGATENLQLIGGTNVTLAEDAGKVTINAAGYTLPAATATVRGGIELFSNTVQSVAANAVTTQSSRTYGVQVNSAGQAVVNVPWTDNNTNQLTTFSIEDGDGTAITMSHGKRFKFVEAAASVSGSQNYINLNWVDTTPGSTSDPYDLAVSHNKTDRTDTADTGSVGFGGSFDVIDSVTTNPEGHITAVNVKSISIPANPNTDSNTFLSDVSVVDNGANIILRHTMSTPNTAHDIGITAGTNITLTEGTDTFEIATTAETNQNAFSTFELGTYTQGGASGTDIVANAKSTEMKLQFWADSFTTSVGGTNNLIGTVRLKDDQSDNIYQVGRTGSGYVKIDASTQNGVDFYNTASTPVVKARITSGGVIHAADDIIAFSTSMTSDVKLKENIERVEGALEKVSQLDGVTFDWKDGRGPSAGVIAQNVEEVLPSAVSEVESLDGNGEHKVVNYNQLSALFIEAIKELKEENKLLRAEIESLKDINS